MKIQLRSVCASAPPHRVLQVTCSQNSKRFFFRFIAYSVLFYFQRRRIKYPLVPYNTSLEHQGCRILHGNKNAQTTRSNLQCLPISINCSVRKQFHNLLHTLRFEYEPGIHFSTQDHVSRLFADNAFCAPFFIELFNEFRSQLDINFKNPFYLSITST